jgi:hypothetical protein
MSSLILSEDTYKRIAEIKALAKNNQQTWEEMEAIAKLGKPIEGLNKEFTMVIMPWYRVTYTEEWQCIGKVLMRHMSVSQGFPLSDLPPVGIVEQIMVLFKFKNKLDDCILHVEKFETDHKAINIMEAIDISMEEANQIAKEEAEKIDSENKSKPDQERINNAKF